MQTVQDKMKEISALLVEKEESMKQICQNLMMTSIYASNTVEAQDQCKEIASSE